MAWNKNDPNFTAHKQSFPARSESFSPLYKITWSWMGWGRYTSDIITGKHEHVHTHTQLWKLLSTDPKKQPNSIKTDLHSKLRSLRSGFTTKIISVQNQQSAACLTYCGPHMVWPYCTFKKTQASRWHSCMLPSALLVSVDPKAWRVEGCNCIQRQ